MLQRTIAGGRTKGPNETSFVFVYQHGDDDVARKAPMIRQKNGGSTQVLSLKIVIPFGGLGRDISGRDLSRHNSILMPLAFAR